MCVSQVAGNANGDHRIGRRAGDDGEDGTLERVAIHLVRIELVTLHRASRQVVKVPTHLADAGAEPDRHESLRLAHLGKGGPLDRSGIEDWRGKRSSIEICRQDLSAMNVPGQNRREVLWQVAPADDVGRGRECEIAWTNCGAFDAVVNAEQSMIGVMIAPARVVDERREFPADIVALVRKS